MIKLKALIVPLGILLLAIGLSACGGSDSGDSEDNKEVVLRFVQEFKNDANHGIVDELMTPGFTHHLTDPRLPTGRDGMKAVGQVVVGGFPDVQVTVQDLLADGDRVIERTAVRATHTGEFNGIPPTGKAVTWTEIHIYRLEDGKIAELWSEIDFLGLLGQLGALPGTS